LIRHAPEDPMQPTRTALTIAAFLLAHAAAQAAEPSSALAAAHAAAARACEIEIRAYCTGLAGAAAQACLRKLTHPVGSRCKAAMDDLDRAVAADVSSRRPSAAPAPDPRK
jgi:hypothetical protein